MAWFGLDGAPIDTDAAKNLIADIDARTVAHDIIPVRPGTFVTVHTVHVVFAETDDDGRPISPLYETTTAVYERAIEAHTTRAAAAMGHARIVERFRAHSAAGAAGAA